MSLLQNSLFLEDVESDVTQFARDKSRKRVLIFPPVNNYRRFLIHQFVQQQFAVVLHTFSIGQGDARRTVVCYKADLIRDPKLDGVECQQSATSQPEDRMGVEGRRSPSSSPVRVRSQRQAKPAPKVEIYRPPAARKARSSDQHNVEQTQAQPTVDSPSIVKSNRQRRPDRAVYVPRHRRSLETDGSPQPSECSRSHRSTRENSTSVSNSRGSSKAKSSSCTKDPSIANIQNSTSADAVVNDCYINTECTRIEPEVEDVSSNTSASTAEIGDIDSNEQLEKGSILCNEEEVQKDSNISTNEIDGERTNIENTEITVQETVQTICSEERTSIALIEEVVHNEKNKSNRPEENDSESLSPPATNEKTEQTVACRDKIANHKNAQMSQNTNCPVLIISDVANKKPKIIKEVAPVPTTPPEKKVKKIERPKSKPAPPPIPVVKINRDECDWDSLFDDNGDCLDPTLIEELTSAVGDVTIEQPKNDYKPYTKHIEVSSDEFAHVIEIYNFPSDFKTCDLATVFSPFKNGGFELKWVDDTHCLGVFSSPLVAAEVLASEHPFVKTRPLSEATALSRTKAKRSAEFLQPYRSRPETCAALARRLVTGALGVKLATARQEREHEKIVLREAKEKRRLANKQREDVWEGIIPGK